MRTILIIGAGFSGVACAVQLLRHAGAAPLRVLLLERGSGLARGLAYGSTSLLHTLNVPAARMSALEHEPAHFLRYAEARFGNVDHASFVARTVYGDYLEWLLRQAGNAAKPGQLLDCVAGDACSLARDTCGMWRVALADGRHLLADAVVLALGHHLPADPPLADPSFFSSPAYQRNPWHSVPQPALAPAAPVLLLGTGLTAVDAILSFLQQQPQPPLLAISRRGQLPQVYLPCNATPAAAPGWHAEAGTVRGALRAFLKQLDAQPAGTHGWHQAMAAARGHWSAIWRGWPLAERHRFLRHVQPYWDSHRHQLAPAAQAQLADARERGILRVMAGTVLDCQLKGERVLVTLRPRGAPHTTTLEAGRVVNCTGPCNSPQRSTDPLVRQLLADELLQPDPLGLGIATGAACAVLDKHGVPVPHLYYLGPWLKADYWEASAVPELRCFAEQIAVACLA